MTGCASGIGRNIVHRLTHCKYSVIGLDMNHTEIPDMDGFYKVDCSNEQEVINTFKEIGTIDIAINCAGIAGVREDIMHLGKDDLSCIIEKNFLSMFLCNKEEIKIMRLRRAGKIINIASILAHIGVKNALPYAASKAAIVALTKTAAAENKDYGIHINSISPATINTPLIEALNKRKAKNYADIYPIGHEGSVDDVFSVVQMLIENNFMTGNDIVLDGGLTSVFDI